MRQGDADVAEPSPMDDAALFILGFLTAYLTAYAIIRATCRR